MLVTALGLAQRYLGTKERAGELDNPDIRSWLARAGFGSDAHDEIPWCGAFVGHVAFLLSLPIPSLPARARSWLTVGTPVDLLDARPGFDVVVFKRGSGTQPGPEVLSAPGHVAWFALLDGADSVSVVGGNQSDAVTLASFPTAQILGIRRLRDDCECV